MEATTAVETMVRTSYGRLVAYLAARSRDVAGAEDALSEALRLLEGEGFDGRLRIFDPGNHMVRNRDGQSSLTTKQLRLFVTIPGGPIPKVEPDPTQYEPHRSTEDDEAARNLGRHLMA